MIYLGTLLLGLACGARTTYALATLSWAARLHRIHLEGSWFAFFGYRATPYLFTAFALGEFVVDKRSSTPSRLVPQQFIARVIAGAVCGAVLGTTGHVPIVGLLLGAVGSIAGTLGGAKARGAVAQRFGKDLPAALLEDALTLVLCVLAIHLAD